MSFHHQAAFVPVGESGSSFFSNGLVSTGLVKPVCEEDKMPLNGPTANFAHIFYQSRGYAMVYDDNRPAHFRRSLIQASLIYARSPPICSFPTTYASTNASNDVGAIQNSLQVVCQDGTLVSYVFSTGGIQLSDSHAPPHQFPSVVSESFSLRASECWGLRDLIRVYVDTETLSRIQKLCNGFLSLSCAWLDESILFFAGDTSRLFVTYLRGRDKAKRPYFPLDALPPSSTPLPAPSDFCWAAFDGPDRAPRAIILNESRNLAIVSYLRRIALMDLQIGSVAEFQVRTCSVVSLDNDWALVKCLLLGSSVLIVLQRNLEASELSSDARNSLHNAPLNKLWPQKVLTLFFLDGATALRELGAQNAPSFPSALFQFMSSSDAKGTDSESDWSPHLQLSPLPSCNSRLRCFMTSPDCGPFVFFSELFVKRARSTDLPIGNSDASTRSSLVWDLPPPRHSNPAPVLSSPSRPHMMSECSTPSPVVVVYLHSLESVVILLIGCKDGTLYMFHLNRDLFIIKLQRIIRLPFSVFHLTVHPFGHLVVAFSAQGDYICLDFSLFPTLPRLPPALLDVSCASWTSHRTSRRWSLWESIVDPNQNELMPFIVPLGLLFPCQNDMDRVTLSSASWLADRESLALVFTSGAIVTLVFSAPPSLSGAKFLSPSFDCNSSPFYQADFSSFFLVPAGGERSLFESGRAASVFELVSQGDWSIAMHLILFIPTLKERRFATISFAAVFFAATALHQRLDLCEEFYLFFHLYCLDLQHHADRHSYLSNECFDLWNRFANVLNSHGFSELAVKCLSHLEGVQDSDSVFEALKILDDDKDD